MQAQIVRFCRDILWNASGQIMLTKTMLIMMIEMKQSQSTASMLTYI